MATLLADEFSKDTARRRAGSRTNRRIVARSRGGPEILELVEEPLPEPGPDQVRVRIEATGVSFADLLMREGVHPETPGGTITPGWDLVGHVDRLGSAASGVGEGQRVAALPVLGGYADYLCLRPEELVPVPDELDAGEAVAMVLNYVTAYQMLHRTVNAAPGQKVLIHGAAGGIGTALLELGRLLALEMYGTASKASHDAVRALGGVPIDYRSTDFVEEVLRMTGNGVHAAFDGIGGRNVWRSFNAVRPGGTVVAFGLTSSLSKGRLAGGLRFRFHGLGVVALYMLASLFRPGRRKIRVYSIQRRMWARRSEFREDLAELFRLLREGEIRPLIAARLPLASARRAHEMLAAGGVRGKIVLLCGRSTAGSAG